MLVGHKMIAGPSPNPQEAQEGEAWHGDHRHEGDRRVLDGGELLLLLRLEDVHGLGGVGKARRSASIYTRVFHLITSSW